MIRKALSDDIEKIAQTYEALLIYEKENGNNTNWRLGIYPTISVPLEQVPKGDMYVLEEENEICASMILNCKEPNEYQKINWQYCVAKEQALVIHTLCVPPQKSGHGYAKQMLKFAIEKAKEKRCKVIRLDTWAGNHPAANLYSKSGFRFAGKAPILLQGVIFEEQIFFELRLEEEA